MTEFKRKMTKALLSLREEMRETLSQHIVEDVYKQFKPAEYERRGTNGGLQEQALNADSHASVSPDGSLYTIYISFKPDGNHPDESEWAEDGVYPVHGDELIGRIENWNPRYSYPPRKRKLPSRPFWKKFVSEMVDNGMAEHFFVSAMRDQGEEMVEDGSIIREPGDGDY